MEKVSPTALGLNYVVHYLNKTAASDRMWSMLPESHVILFLDWVSMYGNHKFFHKLIQSKLLAGGRVVINLKDKVVFAQWLDKLYQGAFSIVDVCNHVVISRVLSEESSGGSKLCYFVAHKIIEVSMFTNCFI